MGKWQMSKHEPNPVVQDFIKFEVKINGDVYVLDQEKDTDITDIHNARNTIPAKIAFMGKVCAVLEANLEHAEMKLEQYIAQQDKFIRERIGKGEEKIMKAIQRKKGWAEYNEKIIEARKKLNIAKGYIIALHSARAMLESKSQDVRKFPELDHSTLNKREFSVKKESRRPIKKGA
jgi:hypothetical protein